MPRKDEGLQKHTLLLKKGDWEKLASFYPDMSTSLVVRALVTEHVTKLEARIPSPKPLTAQVDL